MKETGTPVPRFSDDDVLDFIVKEAMVHKYKRDMKEAEKEAEDDQARTEFRGSHKGLKPEDLLSTP